MLTMRPMLATKGDHLPVGAGWLHEVKWDGMRTLVQVDRRASGRPPRIWSRNENEVTASFPELHPLAQAVGQDLLLDGEVVALADGVPSFGALADRMHVSNPRRAVELATVNPVTLLVFDVLRMGDRDLMGEPLSERRKILQSLGLNDVAWQVPGVYDDGQMLLEATRAQGLEGIVSKRLASRYEPGVRSRHWLKFPHRRRASYVVGGWRPEVDSAHRLGAVLVGEPTPEGLRYRGRVGSGIAGKAGPMLRALMGSLTRDTCPFIDDVPRLDVLGTRWVEPVVVIDVEALGLSAQARLRQPAFVGLRTDLTSADLIGSPRVRHE
jgi:bifunctional non-homologous end joining protein LigD